MREGRYFGGCVFGSIERRMPRDMFKSGTRIGGVDGPRGARRRAPRGPAHDRDPRSPENRLVQRRAGRPRSDETVSRSCHLPQRRPIRGIGGETSPAGGAAGAAEGSSACRWNWRFRAKTSSRATTSTTRPSRAIPMPRHEKLSMPRNAGCWPGPTVAIALHAGAAACPGARRRR